MNAQIVSNLLARAEYEGKLFAQEQLLMWEEGKIPQEHNGNTYFVLIHCYNCGTKNSRHILKGHKIPSTTLCSNCGCFTR